MPNKKNISLTYVEALLLLTQTMSAYALHLQHNVVIEQSNFIEKLTNNLNNLNSKVIELETTQQTTTKIAHTSSTFKIPSFIMDPKIILGVIGTGVIYFYIIPTLGAKIATIPSLKSLFIPLKSSVISLIPFLKEERIIEFLKDGCTYRLKLIGDQVLALDARKVDSEVFEAVSDLIKKENSSVAVKTMETISNAVTTDVTSTSNIVDVTEQTISMLSTL